MRHFTTGLVPSGLPAAIRPCLLHALCAACAGLACIGLVACDQASGPAAETPPAIAPRADSGGATAQRLAQDRAQEARPKIVAFGDSLTAGLGVPADESYPAQLQRRLARAGYDYQVINAGVSGDTTAGGLRRVDWLLKSKPQIVILELGANDGLRGLDLRQTEANLSRIIQRLREAGVVVVLAGMKLPTNYGADYNGRFAALYADLARTHRVTYLPFFLEGVAAHADLNQADGIHPTGEGYRIIVDLLVPILEPLLKKPPAGRS